MITDELATDYYALVGTIAARQLLMSEYQIGVLAEVIINSGFRWVERE